MAWQRGGIYRYTYLWAREHRRREETGRKARPVCLLLKSEKHPQALYLFPLTSKAPAGETVALELPEAECRLAGVRQRCWIVVDEYNLVPADQLYDFETLDEIGRLSPNFLKKVARSIKEAAEARRLQPVKRS